MDSIFVEFSLFDVRDESLPYTGAIPARHERMRGMVPAVEITDDRNRLGIGCPDGEHIAPHTIDFDAMAAEFFVQAKMFACLKEGDIKIGEQRKLLDHGDTHLHYERAI